MKRTTTFLVLLFVTFLGKAQDLQSYIPTDGLLAYYPFNGNANDVSGNGNHGTINGAIFGGHGSNSYLSSCVAQLIGPIFKGLPPWADNLFGNGLAKTQATNKKKNS